ncbi:MAG: LytTR family transcriptional regulator DNA-binding domain-containing protein [Myxococcota bacterium]
MLLKEAHQIWECNVSDITMVRAASVYYEVHLYGGQVAMVREPLQGWEARLPSTFLRIHRSFLVNRSYFQALSMKGRRWYVRLGGSPELLAVSRRLATSIREQLAIAE